MSSSRKRSSLRRVRRRKFANVRQLRSESLESRVLLAGDTWHNFDMPLDATGDGAITPRDALAVFNDLNANGPRELSEDVPPVGMVDVNNDGFVSGIDGLSILQHLGRAQGEGDALIQFRFAVTSRDDLTEVDTLDLNQDFFLRVFATDISPETAGVFSAYLDVEYDANLADADGTIEFSDDFRDAPSGDVRVDGLLDEVGGLNQRRPTDGAAEVLVLSVPMRTESQPGELTFTGNEADVLPLHEVLLYRDIVAIEPSEMMYVNKTVQVRSGDTLAAVNDTYDGTEDTVLTRSAGEGVLSNDAPNSGVTVSLVTNATNGNVNLNDDGSFTYTPDTNFNGTDTFSYLTSDGTQNSNVATVQLTITPVNDTPIARNDSYTATDGVPLTVPELQGLLRNDSDVEGDQLSVVINQLVGPSSGLLDLDADGSFTYTPNASFVGVDTFSYVVSDGSNLSQRATVSISVTDPVPSPTAANDNYLVLSDATLNVPVTQGILQNDSDPDGAALTAQLVSPTSNGVLVLDTDGSFDYSPNNGFIGTDSFTYVANNGSVSSSVATVSIVVQDSNTNGPVAVSDVYTVEEDATLQISSFVGLLANDTDADGDALTAGLVIGPDHGLVTVNSDGSFIYVPDDDFFGSDQFTYRASDGSRSDTATATITVTPIEEAPVVLDDDYSVAFNTELIVSAADGVLANDSDVDNTPLRAQLVIPPVNGSLDLNSDGSFSYTPTDGFEGIDSFIYVVPNGSVSRTAQVQIDVQPEETGPYVNIRLVATDAQGNTLTDAIQVGDEVLLQLFAEDTSPLPREGVFAAYADIEWQPTLATVNGAIQYSDDYEFGRKGDTSTPGLVDEAGAFHRDSSFTGDSELLLTIPLTATGPGVIEFTTNPADVLPFGNILLFDTDEPNVPLDLVVFGSTTVEVEGVPVPVANADSYDAINGSLTVSAANGVLANDLGPNGETIQASLATPPANGSVTLNADGSFTYNADPEFIGTDSFTYRAVGIGASSSLTTVTLNVERTPASVSGLVYFDTNNNGVIDAGEHGFGGLDITLTGTDAGGESVTRTVTTANDGSYRIADLQAGSYVVQQEEPAIVIDGIDSQNGVESSLDDAFSVDLTSGQDMTGLNFGERGLQPAYVGNIMFLGNRLDQGVSVAVRPDGTTSWYCADGDWAGLRSMQATVSGDQRTVTLTAIDNVGQTVSGQFSTGSPNIHLLGNAADGYLVRLMGSSSSFPLSPVVGAAAADAVFGE